MASPDKFDREYRAITAILRRHRKAAGESPWDLAPELGTDQSQISKLERSECLLDIVNYLGIPGAISLDPGKRLRPHPAEFLSSNGATGSSASLMRVVN